MELTDEQWKVLQPLIPEPMRREDGKGRPRRPPREVLDGILWILRTGAQWADLPDKYPPYQTCHRRFQEWVPSGVLDLTARNMVAQIPSGKQPALLALQEEGAQKHLWVANTGSSELWALDTNTREVVAKIQVGAAPNGIAYLPDVVPP